MIQIRSKMLKFLPVVFVIILASGFLGWRMLGGTQTKQSSKVSSLQPVATSSSSLEDRVKELELTVTDLLNKVGGSKSTETSSTSTDTDSKIKNLEAAVNELKSKVAKLETGSTTTSTTQTSPATSTKKPPLYIPLAASLSVSSSSWAEAGGSSFSIDPGDYVGYTNMQLEGNLKAASGNDKASARIKNPDGTSILISEVSTTSQSSVWVSSSGFSLGSGNKTYKIEMKTLTGFGAILDNARIKVNF